MVWPVTPTPTPKENEMAKTIARRYLVSQCGWYGDEPRLMLWNAAGTRVVFTGLPSECRDFCKATNAIFPIEPKPAASVEFTSAPYLRAYGVKPRGVGAWMFQRSTTREAFSGFFGGGEAELFGETVCFYGTLTEAKAQVRNLGWTGFVAVLS